MLGPIPSPAISIGTDFTPLTDPIPQAAETRDNPRQPAGTTQPVELPTDRVDLPSEARQPGSRPGDGESSPATAETSPESTLPQSSVTFRVLRDVDIHIQSRVIDRATREVVRSVPPDQLIDFYERFPPAGLGLDMEA